MTDVIAYRGDYVLLVRGQTMFAEKRDGGRVVIQDNRLAPYLGDLQQGGWVVDYFHLQARADFTNLLVRMPLPSVRLVPGQVMAAQEPSLMGARRQRRRTDAARGLSHVSVQEYVRLWGEEGARIGQRNGSIISWSDGRVVSIPSARERWK
jgi:hypothetical protein